MFSRHNYQKSNQMWPFTRKKKKSINGRTPIEKPIAARKSEKNRVEENQPVNKRENILPSWFLEQRYFADITPITPSDKYKPIKISADMRKKLKDYVSAVMPEPSASFAIYQKLNDPDTTIKEITNLVSSDPMLAAQVLKTVNSALYSLPTEISSVGRAVTLLGFHNIKTIVLYQSLRKGLGEDNDDELSKLIRIHTAMVTSVAHNLSIQVPMVNEYDAATLALLHDMGKILYKKMKDSGKDLKPNSDIPDTVIEDLIASIFGELWNISSLLCGALEFIHYPIYYPIECVDVKIRPIVTVVAVSNFVANATGFPDGEVLMNIRNEYLLDNGLSLEPESWIRPQMVAEIEELRASFI